MTSTKWIEDLPSDDISGKELRLELIRNSSVLDILGTILRREVESTSKCSESDYDNPNWAFRQADRMGYLRALQLVISLTKRK